MKELAGRWLAVAAVAILAVALFYIAYTVHQHNSSIDCLRTTFDQLLLELEHHLHLMPPPGCP